MSKKHVNSVPHVKCVIVGNGSIGKTCLCIRLKEKRFPRREYLPTVMNNFSITTEFNGETVEVSLWDTAGQEDYDRLRPLAYPQTNVFLVCFSVANRYSWDHVSDKVNRWLPEIQFHCPGVPFIFIGLKDDLRDGLMMIFTNMRKVNKLYHGYLRRDEMVEYEEIPLDIFGMIEMYLKEDMDTSKYVSDNEAVEFCKEKGGWKYMACSAMEMDDTGTNELLQQILKCHHDNLKNIQQKRKKKSCHIL